MGPNYGVVLVAAQGLAWSPLAVLWIVAIAPYYRASAAEVALVATAAGTLTLFGAFLTALRAMPAFRVISSWCRAETPTLAETTAAWEAATTSAYRQSRQDVLLVLAIAVVPCGLLAAVVWDGGAVGAVALLLASAIPTAFATVLGYALLEVLTRPLVQEIAATLPDDFAFTRQGLPLQRRLRVSVVVFTSTAGVAVIGLLGKGGGSGQLLVGAVVSGAVGLLVSLWLDMILSHGVTRPVETLRSALNRVQQGDLTTHVPVTSSDELGELSNAFNLMVRGLRERERIRAVFSTYMDKEVARVVLEDRIPEGGFEIDVTLLFCDVKGFTSFAEHVDPSTVIATLNRVFSIIVPIVEQQGGHVDKFLGDGLLAVFGAPERHVDHADRAVAAAQQIVAQVRSAGIGLEIGAGVNTGRVVAGAIGGAGRLNFSVIGDAVNVAARVEAATRATGDDVLVTAMTREALQRPMDLTSRGSVALKGKAQEIELFAPSMHGGGANTHGDLD